MSKRRLNHLMRLAGIAVVVGVLLEGIVATLA
jgi:hypothetical protein